MNPAAMIEAETATDEGIDFIEEIRLRTWARQNYVPGEGRDENWHPVIHDEMRKADEGI